MADFDPITALAGGVLIGLAAMLLLALNGRIAGISGIFAGLLQPDAGEIPWRGLFIAGLALGALIFRGVAWDPYAPTITQSWPLLVAGGAIVGFGTRVGGGCTSGHGVCGIGRLAPRSIVATITFIVAAGITVFVVRHLIGG